MDLKIKIDEIQVLLSKKKFSEAISKSEKLNKKFPNNSYFLNLLGLTLQSSGQIQKSIINFKRALEIEQNNFAAMNNLANSYKKLHQYDQAEIFYLAGESRSQIENSPYLEGYKKNKQDVLLMIDPIDDFVIPQLMEYKGKKLKAINKGESSAKEKSEDEKKVFEGYVGYAKELLDGVKEVKITSRLNESAAVLVGDEFSASPHIEEMMKKMGQPVPERESILEINPDNKLVQQAKSLFEKNKDDDKAKNLTYLIHEQAIIASGAKLKDPSSFINRLNKLLSED